MLRKGEARAGLVGTQKGIGDRVRTSTMMMVVVNWADK